MDIALSCCSERDVAIDFYMERKSMFVYNPELYHWYEYDDGVYNNRKHLPIKLRHTIRTDYIKKCEGILLEYETERIELEKIRLESGVSNFSDEIFVIKDRIKKLTNLLEQLNTTSFLNKVIDELKWLYVRYLPNETFDRLSKTKCQIEQWIYLNVLHEPNNKRMSASDIYEYYPNHNITVAVFGRKLNKCFKPNKKSGCKRFYDNIKIFEDMI